MRRGEREKSQKCVSCFRLSSVLDLLLKETRVANCDVPRAKKRERKVESCSFPRKYAKWKYTSMQTHSFLSLSLSLSHTHTHTHTNAKQFKMSCVLCQRRPFKEPTRARTEQKEREPNQVTAGPNLHDTFYTHSEKKYSWSYPITWKGQRVLFYYLSFNHSLSCKRLNRTRSY